MEGIIAKCALILTTTMCIDWNQSTQRGSRPKDLATNEKQVVGMGKTSNAVILASTNDVWSHLGEH